MSFSNTEQQTSRLPDVEYVTYWPAVVAFVTLAIVLISASIAGLAWKPDAQVALHSQVSGSHISQVKKDVAANLKAIHNDSIVSTEASYTAASQPLPWIVKEQPLPKPPADSVPQTVVVKTKPVIESQTTSPPAVEETRPADTSTETSTETVPNTEPFSLPRFYCEILDDLKQHSKELDIEAVEGSTARILRVAAKAVQGESALRTEDSFSGESVRRRLLAQL